MLVSLAVFSFRAFASWEVNILHTPPHVTLNGAQRSEGSYWLHSEIVTHVYSVSPTKARSASDTVSTPWNLFLVCSILLDAMACRKVT